MNPTTVDSERRGHWTEENTQWYFLLNGFRSLPGFALHSSDRKADLLALRFPCSQGQISVVATTDGCWIQESDPADQPLLVVAEVKVAHCSVHGPWADRERHGMQRAIRRLGFLQQEQNVEAASTARIDWSQLVPLLDPACAPVTWYGAPMSREIGVDDTGLCTEAVL